MPIDPNRKTLRHFYCRDTLWRAFEQMSETMDRGVDELVNEAMRAFAEDNGFLGLTAASAPPPGDARYAVPPAIPHPTPSAPPRPGTTGV